MLAHNPTFIHVDSSLHSNGSQILSAISCRLFLRGFRPSHRFTFLNAVSLFKLIIQAYIPRSIYHRVDYPNTNGTLKRT